MRILGQILLWAGFISAALASTCQREYDLLPEAERSVLKSLPEDLTIDTDELSAITTKSLEELSTEEFSSVVNEAVAVSAANVAASDNDAGDEESGDDSESGDDESSDEDDAPADSEGTAGEEESGPAPVSASAFEKSRTTRIEDKWPTVPWLWYGLSAMVGICGVVILRSTAKSAEQEQGKVAEEFATVTSSLENLIKGVNELNASLDKKSPREVLEFIDDRLAPNFGDFAEARNSLVQRFGLQPYAEIMTQFASSERFINRSWSAAADGYMNEVRSCVERSAAHLQEADALLSGFQSGDGVQDS
ncbi:MAG: hypothetical protein AAF456_18270 [Planctomycetota bacterium]